MSSVPSLMSREKAYRCHRLDHGSNSPVRHNHNKLSESDKQQCGSADRDRVFFCVDDKTILVDAGHQKKHRYNPDEIFGTMITSVTNTLASKQTILKEKEDALERSRTPVANNTVTKQDSTNNKAEPSLQTIGKLDPSLSMTNVTFM